MITTEKSPPTNERSFRACVQERQTSYILFCRLLVPCICFNRYSRLDNVLSRPPILLQPGKGTSTTVILSSLRERASEQESKGDKTATRSKSTQVQASTRENSSLVPASSSDGGSTHPPTSSAKLTILFAARVGSAVPRTRSTIS